MTVPEAGPEVDSLWAEVVGQEAAVSALRAAARHPVHAYLLVGAEGAGTRAAARAFAADLLVTGVGDGARRDRSLVAAETHPDLFVVEREGSSISRDQAREVIRRANLTPPEGARQVLLLTEFHLVTDVGPTLLKTLEEPPPATHFVVLADEVTPELVTIASRCVQVRFPPLAEGVIIDRLIAEGAGRESAAAAARLAAGDLGRARNLLGDSGAAHRAALWAEVPDRLSGSGASILAEVARVLASVAEAAAPMAERHQRERSELEGQLERSGERGAGRLTRLTERHRRETRRLFVDEIRAGMVILGDRYRGLAVAGGPTGVADLCRAGDAIATAVTKLPFNPSHELLLAGLFAALVR